MRAGGLALALLGLFGCGANASITAGAGAVDDDPQPVSENQQGRPELAVAASFPMTSSPLADTYIWCADSAGLACLRATAALGAVAIKNPINAPPELFDLEDLPDDCLATGMTEIRSRLERALTLSASGWRDQGGNRLDADQFSNIYAASGCVSDAASPVVKIAATASTTPRRYLVRVWETGDSY
jgi:hypothetical protein